MSQGKLHIVIDGYNLIGVLHRNLYEERERLISKLIEYRKHAGHELLVVFDGWSSDKIEAAFSTEGFSVLFSQTGETADNLIRRLIGMRKRKLVIVSSDKEIASFAWAHDCVPITASDFLKKIEVPYLSKCTVSTNKGDNYKQPTFKKKKGNPYTLSKKERAIRAVLEKL
ncbi:MAG: NYN domain-containing protein [Candidatus Magnetoovum sp. WYHC-5]|nr:NYN domain-containing protein [Candidatus Magnetoovum sp. WYHC-5]